MHESSAVHRSSETHKCGTMHDSSVVHRSARARGVMQNVIQKTAASCGCAT
jgi:hypothetical protein